MVDEHYYNSPTWFLQNNDRYDSYDRNGPKVFLGEYASQDNKLFNALAEAAYMTGLERNADVVKLASYAPLLANIDHVQWRPDMIWFDNDESWGSTSYQVQKLFMNNVGDRVVPSTATGTVDRSRSRSPARSGCPPGPPPRRYDDVRVTAPDGTVLFSDDFSDRRRPVDAAGEPRAPGRSSTARTCSPTRPRWTPWSRPATSPPPTTTCTLKATKTSGAEGFLVAFGVQGHRQLLLVEPRRLEQHPGRGREGRRRRQGDR